jgi:hypothetical protein
MVEDGWAHILSTQSITQTEQHPSIKGGCAPPSLYQIWSRTIIVSHDVICFASSRLSCRVPTVTKFLLSSALPCSPLQHGRQRDKEITTPILALLHLSFTPIPHEVKFLLSIWPPMLPYIHQLHKSTSKFSITAFGPSLHTSILPPSIKTTGRN